MSNISQWQGISNISNEEALPYNFNSTPILGSGHNPNIDTPEFAEIIAATQQLNSQVTPDEVKQAWQEYFYVFQPFVTDEVYDYDPVKLEDPDSKVDTGAYYSGLFLKKYKQWQEWKSDNGASLSDNSFVHYLNHVDDSGSRQKNVIFWQFLEILEAISLLDSRTINAANRRVLWQEAQLSATQEMKDLDIPEIRPYPDDNRVPDPESIKENHEVMMDIERARRKQKTASERGRIDDTNFTFSNDAKAMHMSSLRAFWQTMSKVLGSVINI